MLNLNKSFAGYAWEAAEKDSDPDLVFRPVDDLWLKVSNAMPEKPTAGTLAFCGDVLECLLDEDDE